MLFEPPETWLPEGLLASFALMRVPRSTVYVPVINVEKTDILLFQNSVLGTLHSVFIVSSPRGISERKSVSASVNLQVSVILPSV